MKVYNTILDLIGGTPLVRLSKLNTSAANVLVKLEYFNPANSIKDRPAKFMLENAIKKGFVDKDTTIIEATSGNFGIGLAMCCAVMGLKLVITMPDNMSEERKKMLKGYGAELVLTPAELGMKGAIDEAQKIIQKSSKIFMPSQFDNSDNAYSHELTTAKELFDDTDGKIDVVVAGIGTGGTISGIARKLKELKPSVQVIGVEPKESPLLTDGHAGFHKIQGIGANFIPKILDLKLIDKIYNVTYENALKTAKEAAKKEGILCGISSGATIYEALELAKSVEYSDKLIVAIAPDYGERYVSTELFED